MCVGGCATYYTGVINLIYPNSWMYMCVGGCATYYTGVINLIYPNSWMYMCVLVDVLCITQV